MPVCACRNGHLTHWRNVRGAHQPETCWCGERLRRARWDLTLHRYVWPDMMMLGEVVDLVLGLRETAALGAVPRDWLVDHVEDLVRRGGRMVDRRVVEEAIQMAIEEDLRAQQAMEMRARMRSIE